MGTAVDTPPTMGLSDRARRGQEGAFTSLDSVSLFLTQTLDIPFTVAWPADILPETSAGVSIPSLSTKIPLVQHLQPVMRFCWTLIALKSQSRRLS